MKKRKSITIIFLVLVSIIVVNFILWLNFRPAKQLNNKLNKINNTRYDLERTNETYASYGNCRVSVYPTTNLMVPNLVQSDKTSHSLFLFIGSSTSPDKGCITVQVIPTANANEDIITEMNNLSNFSEPKISTEYNTLNYFIYDEKKYYYNLNSSTVMFTTPINNNYLYWIMIDNYKNLNLEDIKSILHFEKIGN